MDQNKTFLTVDDVSKMLQVHWQTVLGMIRGGKLRAVKLGKGYRIDSGDLEAYLESIKTHLKDK